MKRRGVGYYAVMAGAWTLLAVLFSLPRLRVAGSWPLMEIVWLVAGFHWAFTAYLLIFRRGQSNGGSGDATTPRRDVSEN